jgi:Flp pilus assembly protein CpaB
MRPLLLLAALAACHPVADGYAPPAGKRAATLPVAPGQARYLVPGDRVELVVLSEGTRQDGSPEPRSEAVAPSAEVLRVDAGWSKDSALVSVALYPAEAHWAALALDLERQVLLQKLSGEPARLERAPASSGAGLDAGQVGAALNVHPDQVEFLGAGRRVDVVVTRASGKGAKEDLSARTAVQDALVLGVTQAKEDDEWATVQLAVTPEQARMLAEAAGAEDQFLLLARAPGDRATAAVEVVRSNSRLGRAGEASSPSL